MEIRKVLLRKDGIKYVIIPKKSEIKEGQTILITNNLKLINEFIDTENGKEGRRKE